MSIPAEQQSLNAPFFSASSSPNTFMPWSSSFAFTPQTACSAGNSSFAFTPQTACSTGNSSFAFTPQTACSEVAEPCSLRQILEKDLGNHNATVEDDITYIDSSEGESDSNSEDDS